MNWIKNNVAILIGLLVWAIIGIAGVVKFKFSAAQQKLDCDKLELRFGTAYEKLEEKVRVNEGEMREHIKRTDIHIDPHRDEKRFDDFKTEIFGKFADVKAMQEETNRKIDRIQILHAPPTSL